MEGGENPPLSPTAKISGCGEEESVFVLAVVGTAVGSVNAGAIPSVPGPATASIVVALAAPNCGSAATGTLISAPVADAAARTTLFDKRVLADRARSRRGFVAAAAVSAAILLSVGPLSIVSLARDLFTFLVFALFPFTVVAAGTTTPGAVIVSAASPLVFWATGNSTELLSEHNCKGTLAVLRRPIHLFPAATAIPPDPPRAEVIDAPGKGTEHRLH